MPMHSQLSRGLECSSMEQSRAQRPYNQLTDLDGQIGGERRWGGSGQVCPIRGPVCLKSFFLAAFLGGLRYSDVSFFQSPRSFVGFFVLVP